MSNQLSAQVNIDVSVAVSSLDKLGNAVSQFTAQFQQEVNQTARSADKLEKEFVEVGRDAKKMATEVKKATAPLDKLQSELAQTAVAAAKAGDTLDRKVKPAAQAATRTFVDFGRIAQDAAFGPIAIANNIEPLLLSLRNLGQQSKGVGSFFAALGKSLLGPGGLLLGFSLLTFEMSGGIDALKKYIPGFKELARVQEAAKKSAQDYKDAQKATQESIFQQRIETEQLVKVARGDIGSKAEQEAALRKLNSAIPDYIGVLDQQNIKTAEGVTIIDKYINALEKQAIAELLVNRVASLSVKRLDEEQRTREQLTNNLQRQADIRAQLASVEGQRGDVGAARRGALRTQLIETQKGFEEIIGAFETGRKGINEEIDRLRKEIDKNTVIIDPSKDTKEDKFNFQEYLKRLIKDLELTARATPAKVGLPLEVEILQSGIEIATGRVQRINKLVESAINTNLATQGRPLEYKPLIVLKPEYDTENFRKTLDQLNSTIRAGLEDTFTNLGEAIGGALGNGTNAIKALASGLLGALGSLISSIGKALIQYGIVKSGLDKVIKGGIALPGAVAIGLGLAAVALGQLVKTAIPAFATGGIVTGPTLGLIGEGGQPEVILPLSKINQFMEQGGGGGGRLEAIVSGDALRFILNRNDRKQRRLL